MSANNGQGPTPDNPLPGLTRELKQKGYAAQDHTIELSIGAMEGSVVIDWGEERSWMSMQPEAVPSFISAIVSAVIEAQKQIQVSKLIEQAKEEEKKRKEDKEW